MLSATPKWLDNPKLSCEDKLMLMTCECLIKNRAIMPPEAFTVLAMYAFCNCNVYIGHRKGLSLCGMQLLDTFRNNCLYIGKLGPTVRQVTLTPRAGPQEAKSGGFKSVGGTLWAD